MSKSDGEDSVPLEETLLLYARKGHAIIISDILKSWINTLF